MNNKEIISLDDFEYVLAKPTIFVGSVEPSEETVPIINEGNILAEHKSISVGFYKLLNEIVDNAFDEAKRCNGRMKNIKIEIYSDNNKVIVTDNGDGFYNGYKKNSKTGLSNIETAMGMLRAGSNFKNQDVKDTLIGTNGVGASVVNMLSDYFSVDSSDGKKRYIHTWEKFVTTEKKVRISKKKGTTVSFIPREDKFPGCKWDLEILKTSFTFRNWIKNNDNILKDIKFEFYYDNQKIDISSKFYSEGDIFITSKLGQLIIKKSTKDSTKISFVNGTQTSGIHQKIIQDWINTLLGYDKAHEFYDTIINLSLEPKYVTFGDQNKTRFVSTRAIIEPLLDKAFKTNLRKTFKDSDIFKSIKEDIDNKLHGSIAKQIKNISNKKKLMLSDKYHPPSGKKDMIFIVEGGSALGSILQRRDSKTMGAYSLKGKIKNVKSIKDLTTNIEIADLIQILGLDMKGEKEPKYKKIVIAVDADEDGNHISSLIINFIYRWFPYIIQRGMLYQLLVPIVNANDSKGNLLRFYTMDEFRSYKNKLNHVSYMKGLGSLEKHDWEHIFNDINLVRFEIDKDAESMLNLAFGDSADDRKIWLSEKI